MAMTTSQQMLDKYMEAELAVLDGKTVMFGGRTLTMADLNQIREGRLEWERKVKAEQAAASGQKVGYSLASFCE